MREIEIMLSSIENVKHFVQTITMFDGEFELVSGKYIVDAKYIEMFFETTVYFTLFYIVVVIIGLVKSAPKNEYTDIEHGSSDWSENGEQYRILSKNKGIILAQNNYLPINKRGNVNVLVVGRFGFW